MNNSKNSVLVALVVAAIGFFVISQTGLKKVPAITPAAQQQIVATPTITPAESKEVAISTGTVEVEAGSFYYKPNILKLKKGEKVTIKLNSVDMMHDFIIDDLALKIPVTKSGNSATVEFIPTKTGEFEFYCSVGNGYHKKQGQVGKLIVVE